MSNDNELKKTLGLFTSVGLAITMVVGSGLLILPGLAYRRWVPRQFMHGASVR
jgi:amino acid transporter